MSLHTQQARPIAIGRKPFAISVRNSAWDQLARADHFFDAIGKKHIKAIK